MKKILLTAFAAAAAAFGAMAADVINYSAVVRGGDHKPLTYTEIGLKFEFMANGVSVYTETGTAVTNSAGVLNYAIGSQQSMDHIDWSDDIRLVVSADLYGDKRYILLSEDALAAVPYALQSSYDAEQNAQLLDQQNRNENYENAFNEIVARLDDQANRNENYENAFNQLYIATEGNTDEIREAIQTVDELKSETLPQIVNDIERISNHVENMPDLEGIYQLAEVVEVVSGKFPEVIAQLDWIANEVSENEDQLNDVNERVKLIEDEHLPVIQNEISYLNNRIESIPGIEGVDEFNAKLDGFVADLRNLNERLNDIPGIDGIEAFGEEVKELEAQVADTQNELRQHLRNYDYMCMEIESLNCDIWSLEDEVGKLKVDSETTRNDVDDLMAVREETYEIVDYLWHNIDMLRETSNRLESDNDETRGMVEAMANWMSENTARVESRMCYIEAMIDEFKSRLEAISGIENIEDVANTLEQFVNDLKNLNDRINAIPGIEGIEALGAELAAMKADAVSTRMDLENLGENYMNLGNQVEVMRSDLENLGENYINLGQQVEANRADIERIDGRIDAIPGVEDVEQLANIVEEHEGQITRLRDDLNGFSSDIVGMVRNVQGDVNGLMSLNADTRAHLDNLDANFHGLSGELSATVQLMTDLDSKVDALTAANEELEAKNDALEQTAADQQAQIHMLEMIVNELRMKVETLLNNQQQ